MYAASNPALTSGSHMMRLRLLSLGLYTVVQNSIFYILKWLRLQQENDAAPAPATALDPAR
jgi:hypothetical protein